MNGFQKIGSVWFKPSDLKKIHRMSGDVHIISTVCPDYPNNGQGYTFQGELGSGVSLTAKEHLFQVPSVLAELKRTGTNPRWQILLADLPELVESQREFYERVAGSKDEYLRRSEASARAIADLARIVESVETFYTFYGGAGIDYLAIQEKVAVKIKKAAQEPPFCHSFNSFMFSRRSLAEKFRGRSLSTEELAEAAAHGMSLYITHGTLLRHIFQGRNLVVVNHQTTNLQNFYLCEFVERFQHLQNTPKFPLGVISGELY